jgi:hypothetical protein
VTAVHHQTCDLIGFSVLASSGPVSVVVDPYYALEVFNGIHSEYLRELEQEGSRDDADMDEVLTRWVVRVFSGVAELTPGDWSYSAKCGVFDHVSREINRRKKSRAGVEYARLTREYGIDSFPEWVTPACKRYWLKASVPVLKAQDRLEAGGVATEDLYDLALLATGSEEVAAGFLSARLKHLNEQAGAKLPT